MQVEMGIRIQQLCISKISKNGKSVGFLDTKDKVEEGSIQLNIKDLTNFKLFFPYSEPCNALDILNEYKASHDLN